MPLSAFLALAILAGLAAPTAAAAATATVFDRPPTPYSLVQFNAAAGQENDLHVRLLHGGPEMVLSDPGDAVVARAGCVQFDGGSAQCTGSKVDVRLRDLDDRADVLVNGEANVWGGNGDDHLFADSFISAGSVYGESGDDDVSAGGEANALADGGPGNDEVRCCGYARAGTAVGGAGNDLIRFQTVYTNGAALLGGTGNDTVVAQPPGNPGTASGGDGADIIVVHGQQPLHSNAAGYAITGDAGDDTIVGGPDGDTIDAGEGRDFVDVLNGGSDTVVCGPGADIVRFDAADEIADDCEITLPPVTGTE